MDKRLLDILCCPDSRQPLLPLPAAQRERINAAIASDGLRNGAGETTREALQDGLVTRDGRTVYRIVDGIPVLLADEAIDIRSIDGHAGQE
ncbi:MAG: Trm112 family protein [Lysobacteraceae bacterium]